MRSILYGATAIGVLALAAWAYEQNYRTQAALGELDRVRAEIGALSENAAVLRAEWAYLNRPERLRHLADMNFERLGLMPLEARSMGRVSDLPLDLGAPVLTRAGAPRTPAAAPSGDAPKVGTSGARPPNALPGGLHLGALSGAAEARETPTHATAAHAGARPPGTRGDARAPVTRGDARAPVTRGDAR